MRFAGRCFASILLAATAAASAAAGTFFWSPIPFRNSTDWPGRGVLTADPQIVYAIGFTGLHRSDDAGRRWRQIDTPVGVDSLAVDPHDPLTIFTDVYGQVLRSADGGASWQVVLENPLGSGPLEVLASRQEGRVYAVSAESLWESADGGVTFARRSALPSAGELPQLSLDEAADGGLYLHSRAACGHYGCGNGWRIDRSADQGRTWILVEGGELVNPVVDLVPHPVDPAGVFVTRRDATNSHNLLFSADRGASFTSRGLAPTGGELFASPPDNLFLPGNYRFWRSVDGGRSWNEGPRVPEPEGIHAFRYAFYPPSRVIFQWSDVFYSPPAEPSVYASADGGASWTPMEVEGPSPDLVYDAAASGPGPTLYLDANGRMARSQDGGETWQSFEAPRVLGGLIGDPLDGDTVYASGFLGQGDGILRSRDGGASFQLVFDQMDVSASAQLVAFRRGDATSLVVALPYGNLARSADGGDTWQAGPVVLVPPGEAPRLVHLVESLGVVYAVEIAGGPVYRSTDAGATFVRLEISASRGFTGGGGLIADLDRNTNAVRVSRGGPWQTMPLPFPLGFDAELRADPSANLYLLGRGYLLRSRDQGRSWQSLSQGLPEVSSQPALLFDPAVPDRLYLASSAGFHAGDFAGNPPLALSRGRFEARARWRLGPAFPWAEGAAASISDQSGVFRFFSPERAEIAVQILDGRAISGKFWTFVASMTDVEVEVEVKDRLTGDTWRHHQPAGQALSTADFGAFPRENQPTAGGLPRPFGGFAAPAETVLLANRFEVSASRPAPYAFAPVGRQLFGDSAGFTFFDPSAMDLVVNVIDGRAVNGKWWVFAGSLTDQEFTITVRDTATGAVKSYPNPVGGFAGFGDTDAF